MLQFPSRKIFTMELRIAMFCLFLRRWQQSILTPGGNLANSLLRIRQRVRISTRGTRVGKYINCNLRISDGGMVYGFVVRNFRFLETELKLDRVILTCVRCFAHEDGFSSSLLAVLRTFFVRGRRMMHANMPQRNTSASVIKSRKTDVCAKSSFSTSNSTFSSLEFNVSRHRFTCHQNVKNKKKKHLQK